MTGLTRKRTKRVPHPARRVIRKQPPTALDTRQVIQQIDAMIRELETLRRELTTQPKAVTPSGLTEELFGAAGQGTRDEYDLDLDWVRFSE